MLLSRFLGGYFVLGHFWGFFDYGENFVHLFFNVDVTDSDFKGLLGNVTF